MAETKSEAQAVEEMVERVRRRQDVTATVPHGSQPPTPERDLLAAVVELRKRYPNNDTLLGLQETMEMRANREYADQHHLPRFLDNLLKQSVSNRTNYPIHSMVRALESKTVE